MTLNPVVPLRLRIPEWTFAERLRKGRRDARLSQSEMASLLGVKESTFSAWETGRNTPDIAELAPRLEEITGVSRMFYIGWTIGNPTPGGEGQNSQQELRFDHSRAQVIPFRPRALAA